MAPVFVPAAQVVTGISAPFESGPPSLCRRPPTTNRRVCLFLGPLMPIDPDNQEQNW